MMTTAQIISGAEYATEQIFAKACRTKEINDAYEEEHAEIMQVELNRLLTNPSQSDLVSAFGSLTVREEGEALAQFWKTGYLPKETLHRVMEIMADGYAMRVLDERDSDAVAESDEWC